MLSSEDAFSYVIARTEKSGLNGQQQAEEGERTGKANRSIRAQKLGRSSLASAHVSAPSDRKKCVVNAVRFQALLAYSAFGISGADMGALPLVDVPAFGRWEIFVKTYPSVVF